MKASYSVDYKRLWVVCARKGLTPAELRKRAGISPATLTKLRKNKEVAMEVILRLAGELNCREPSELMEFVPFWSIPDDDSHISER